jgi:hypothetical protein
MAACDQDGYEESTSVGAGVPRRPGLPPWELLGEEDPVQKVADEAAVVGNSFVVKNCDSFTT